MNKIRKLLAATDFSDNARQAAMRAALLAAELDAQLDLLHVMNGPSLGELRKLFGLTGEADAKLQDDALRTLQELTENIALQTGKAAIPQVQVGQVDSEILRAADQADMLVIGARGLSPLRDVFLGTTAEKLLRKCARPVLVNKRPPQGPYQRILVAMDLVSDSSATLQMALQIAPGASVTAVHAFDLPFEGKLWLAGVSDVHIQHYRDQTCQQAHEKICAIAENLCDSGLRLHQVVEHGDAARIILEQQDILEPDLIIVGRRARSLMGEMLLGSVTRHILSYSRCDVLIANE